MNPITIFYFLLLLTLWPYQIFASNAVKTSDLITQTCDQSLYKDLCKEVLKSGKDSNAADLHGLAITALSIASSNASNIYDHINDLINATSEVPSIQQCLQDCSENYQDAVDQLEDSLAALDSRGFNDVNTWVTAAMSDIETCEMGFKDKQDHESPLAQANKLFSQLCSIALTVTNQLAKA